MRIEMQVATLVLHDRQFFPLSDLGIGVGSRPGRAGIGCGLKCAE